MFSETTSKLKVLQAIEVEVPGDLQELDRLLLEFNQIHRDYISNRDWLQCRLALAEGFTNAVRHAHRNIPKEVPIQIEVLLRRDSMEIRIWDYGAVFDLQNFITESAKKHGGWLASGRGIPLMNKIADVLNYQRTKQQKNCLLIVKKFSDRQEQSSLKS